MPVPDQSKNAKVGKLFDAAPSVEGVGLYKLRARVYGWAARRAGADVSE